MAEHPKSPGRGASVDHADGGPEEPRFLEGRLVAFLDILGFSNRLTSTPISELHDLYSALIDDVNTTIFGDQTLVDAETKATNFDKAQFLFDSVVLVSHPTTGSGSAGRVWNFISGVACLMEKSYARQLPLRGCIGFGDFLDDDERGIFLSACFPEIVRAEKEQEWSGAFLHAAAAPLVLKALCGSEDEARGTDMTQPVVRYAVPLKKQRTAEHWCINWVCMSDAAGLAAGTEFLEGPKGANTTAFVAHVEAGMPSPFALPNGFLPAVHLRVQAVGPGMRLKFTDAQGRAVDPPDGARVNIGLLRVLDPVAQLAAAVRDLPETPPSSEEPLEVRIPTKQGARTSVEAGLSIPEEPATVVNFAEVMDETQLRWSLREWISLRSFRTDHPEGNADQVAHWLRGVLGARCTSITVHVLREDIALVTVVLC